MWEYVGCGLGAWFRGVVKAVFWGRGLEVRLRACFGGVVSDTISGVYRW